MNIYSEILNLQNANLAGVLVTVIDKKGHGPQIPGTKILITDNKIFGTIGGGALEYIVIEESKIVLENQFSYIKKYNLDENGKMLDGEKTGMLCGGEITLFFECINTKPNVYIFGAGHVAQAAVYFLSKLDYKITVIDSRKELAVDFDSDINYINEEYTSVISGLKNTGKNFAVITTHSHDLDYNVLKSIYMSDWKPEYIGLIASKKKSDTLIGRLTNELEGKLDLSILYSPIGLKTGGRAPVDIGLSIASEIQALRYGIEGNKHSSKNWSEMF